jgi:hypothetical protein
VLREIVASEAIMGVFTGGGMGDSRRYHGYDLLCVSLFVVI